ncbi:MAG: DUF4190 domain-containing protein [Phycisphaerales bacterium]
MFCPTCGTRAIDGASHCTKCGKQLPRADGAPDQLKGLEPVLPINTSFWAIAAGYLGLFSVLLVFAPFALICGILALLELKKSPGRRGHVRAWLGIVMGTLGTIGLLLLVVSTLNR